MTRHQIIPYWSAEDAAFNAEVPELPGCAADGATRQEALSNAEIAIAEWLETARALGRVVPVPNCEHLAESSVNWEPLPGAPRANGADS